MNRAASPAQREVLERLQKDSQQYRERRGKNIVILLGILLAAGIAVVLWRLTYGEMGVPVSEVFRLLFSADSDILTSPEAIVVRNVRLPRLLAAFGVGASLAVSGVVLQGILQNPLAEPYTLGIASGAAFGGALVFSLNVFAVVPAAFVGATAALAAVYVLSKHAGGGRIHFVLAGIIVSSFLSSGVTFLKAIASERLSAIVMWLMGGFSGASNGAALTVWLFAALSLGLSLLFGRQLDAISLGDETGSLLGVDEKKLRVILLCAVSLSSAASVSYFGIIGFVGLVVPHLLRMMIGALHRPLIICSFLAGGVLMAAADGLAQICWELPVGVITALLGAPFFCWIMVRRKMMNP